VRAVWLMVVAVLALAGCTSETTGAPAKDDSPSVGAVSLVVPIEMRPVVEQETGPGGPPTSTSAAPDGDELPGPDGELLTLGEPMMVVEELDGAEIKADETTAQWMLILDLNEEDARTFGDWTANHTGERLAMVIDGEVVIAPEIQSAITGGQIQITGQYTQSQIRDLLDKITGR
jgi:preprotein translocase subunit SecD